MPILGRASAQGRRRARLTLAFACLALASGPAFGQVIEIDDEGTATVYDGPTWTSVEAKPAPTPNPKAATTPVDDTDPFETAARNHGVDVALLRAVAWTESRGRNDAVSPKGALGIMQLMPGTAAELGVDPRDPRSNINGGAAYLAQQIRRFGSVPLALAAYNAGPGAVLRFRGIPPFAETKGYVASVLQRWGGQVPPAPAPAAPAPSPTPAPTPAAPVMLMEVPAL